MASIYQMKSGSWRVDLCINKHRKAKTFKREADARSWADAHEQGMVGIDLQRRLIKDHKIAAFLPEKYLEAVDKANYSHAEILMHAMPANKHCCIYFLIKHAKVKYVGQTVNLYHRLAQHVRGGNDFESYSFIPCEKDQLDELEQIYINLLMPVGNRRGH